jgi:hypothetical protein
MAKIAATHGLIEGNLTRCAVGRQLTINQHQHPVGDAKDGIHIVFGIEYGQACRCRIDRST